MNHVHTELEQSAEALYAQRNPPLLMFDYDGTLAPFVVDRDAAYPYPEARRLVATLHTATAARVAIVSGRAVADVRRLLDMPAPVEIWGCHGWERQLPNGQVTTGTLPNAALEFFARLQSWSEERGCERRLEIKPASVALHWRGLSQSHRRELEAELRRRFDVVQESPGLEIHPFDGGLEWRLPGWSKANAVTTLCREMAADSPSAYFGDDLTDEDAFKALPEAGLGVLVRAAYRPTAASLWLQPPEELCRFLELICDGLQRCHATGRSERQA